MNNKGCVIFSYQIITFVPMIIHFLIIWLALAKYNWPHEITGGRLIPTEILTQHI
jgi:hypothetical protein